MTTYYYVFVLCVFTHLLLNLVVPCHSCGTRPFFKLAHESKGGLVHGELAQRSRFLFAKQHNPQSSTYLDGYAAQMAQWLESHDGSIVAGSFMPDWYSHPNLARLTFRGYGCSGGDNLSEMSNDL